jgi:hypothetical protein
VLAGKMEAPVLREVAVADDRAQGEDCLGSVQSPPGAGPAAEGPASSAASAVNMAREIANGSSGGTAEYAAMEGSSFLGSGSG